MTALLFRILVERKIFSWWDTLESIFPKYPEMLPVYKNMPIGDVLAHFSTLPRNYSGFTKDEEIKKQIGSIYENPGGTDCKYARNKIHNWALQWEFDPGQFYSNVGYDLIGNAIETHYNQWYSKRDPNYRAKSFEEIMSVEVLDKLDLGSCGYGPATIENSVEQPWGHRLLKDGTYKPEIEEDLVIQTPAGRVHGSLSDIYKYLTKCYQGYHGESDLMSRENFRILFTEYKHPSLENWMKYGHGWGIRETDGSSGLGTEVSHEGSDGYSQFLTYINFKQKKAVAIAANANEYLAKKENDRYNICEPVLKAILKSIL